MPIDQPEKGERSVARYRYRQTIGPAKGWDDSHDPSTLEPEYLVKVVNARIHDGIMVSRGGQSKVVGTGHEMTGCVYGMVEVEGGLLNKLLLHVNAAPVAEIFRYNPELDPPDDLVSITDQTTGTNQPPSLEIPAMQRFEFVLYNRSVCWIAYEPVAGGSYQYVLKRMVPPTVGDTTLGFKSESIMTLDFQPSSMAVLPAPGDGTSDSDILFFGTVDGGVKVYTESRELHEIAPAATFDDRVLVFAYHNTIYAASLQEIRRLNGWQQGATSWSWTNVTMPAGAYPTGVTGFYPTGTTVMGDDAYICGWDTLEGPDNGPGCILKLTESTAGALTCTVAHAIRDLSSPPYITSAWWISDICAYNGELFYGWSGKYDSAVTTFIVVGKGDGVSTWTDNVQFFAEGSGYVGRIYTVGGNLYLTAWASFYGTQGLFLWNGLVFNEKVSLVEYCMDMMGV